MFEKKDGWAELAGTEEEVARAEEKRMFGVYAMLCAYRDAPGLDTDAWVAALKQDDDTAFWTGLPVKFVPGELNEGEMVAARGALLSRDGLFTPVFIAADSGQFPGSWPVPFHTAIRRALRECAMWLVGCSIDTIRQGVDAKKCIDESVRMIEALKAHRDQEFWADALTKRPIDLHMQAADDIRRGA